MDNMENKDIILDAHGDSVELNSESFKLIQTDKKIYDQKFETKPTTFAKDALKRFAKNKSSIVGAVIIGVILLGCITIPVFSQHDINNVNISVRYLPPKLFKTGSGWWDGTQKITGYVDQDTNTVATYNEAGIYKVLDEYYAENDGVYKYGKGGTFVYANDNSVDESTVNDDSKIAFMFNKTVFTFNSTDNDVLNFTICDDISDNMKTAQKYKIGSYQVSLVYKDDSDIEHTEILKTWSTDLGDFSYNLSSYGSSNSATVKFEVKPYLNNVAYIGIDSLSFSTNSTDESKLSAFDSVSISDGNVSAEAGQNNDSGGVYYSDKQWIKNGYITVSKTVVKYRTFIYDPYEVAYGNVKMQIGESIMNEYIANGWCKYDYTVGISSFEVLSDECPINEVLYQKTTSAPRLDPVYEMTCNVTKYKYMGLKKMPTYLFGTDVNGFDIVKLCFRGLGVSLLMAVAIFLINFVIGIIYGSVEGYYGGTVDIIMERITEIVGGMPFIAIITLLTQAFGRTIGVFIIAETITSWVGDASLARTQFYRFRGREYVLASRTLGAKDSRLIFKHILPNGLGTIITSSVLSIPSIILGETTVSYLGLGIQSFKTFGVIVSENQNEIQSHPALILFPSVIVALLMIAFNLFGNGLRDAVDPSQKGGE